MDDSQGINRCDNILDIIFDPNSNEMDKKEIQINMENMGTFLVLKLK